jgi:flavin-binding protein dodecin
MTPREYLSYFAALYDLPRHLRRERVESLLDEVGLTEVEKAIENAVKQASKTVKNIKGVYADGIQALVEDGNIVAYRVNCKVTFVVA